MGLTLIEWNEQVSRWFIEASEFTGFHKSMAKKIIPYLKSGYSMCDIGCGLGRLDLELAPYVSEILAVDISADAVKRLARDAGSMGVNNIKTRCGDAADILDSFDIILLSLYGQPDMRRLLSQCRHKLIRIVSSGKKSGLYPERYRREIKNAVPDVQNELRALGIVYDLEYCAIESGQPMRSIQEAEEFILSNAPEASPEEISVFLSENIIKTGKDDFPLFLPYMKEFGIFVIDNDQTLSALN